MSKKHFEAIAATIRMNIEAALDAKESIGALVCVAEDLANEFAEFNGRFNRAEFLYKCGVGGS